MAKKAYVNDGTDWVELASAATDLSAYQQKVTGVSDTEIGYLDGVTSSIQAQINSKAPISPTTQTGFKNVIINGDFRINQRNGTTQVVSPVSATKYVTDRWATYRASYATGARYQTVTVDTSLLPNVSLEAARVGRVNATTGTGVIAFRQPIEIDNIGHTVGQVMTLSFYARAGENFSAASSILTSEIYEDTVEVSPGGATTSPKNTYQSNTLTTSWQRFTQTFTRDSAKQFLSVSFNYDPVGTAGTADHFEITGIQLELGTIATPFEQRPIGTELALCQRYYWKSENDSYFGIVVNTGIFDFRIDFPVEMRIRPSSTNNISSAILGISPTATQVNVYNGAFTTAPTTFGTPVAAMSSKKGGVIRFSGGAGGTNGFGGRLLCGTSVYFDFDAEL